MGVSIVIHMSSHFMTGGFRDKGKGGCWGVAGDGLDSLSERGT